MAFASFDPARRSAPMAEINMVPLIDVMLVLLVVFMVTAPLLTHSVKLDLPRASGVAAAGPAEKIELAIDRTGQLFWNGEPASRAQASERMAAAASRTPQPELHIRADQEVRYALVAQTLADAAKAGLQRVGFITRPDQP
ncbi:MAG: biopolymer transporter ExbD [Burkholderiaceae bacterium]